VEDNGCGNRYANRENRQTRALWIDWRERAEQIGAVLTIASRSGEGTKVTVTVPGKRAFREAQSHD
jgi:nitrate/nitrite-specific signal transduction histidine kinase